MSEPRRELPVVPRAESPRPVTPAGRRATQPTEQPAAAPAQQVSEPVESFYDAVGGEPTFRALVARFYAGVAEDPLLRPLYPEEDLGPAEERLRMFLIQYWGGPRTYSERRGHPRLRMRHVRFAIGERERLAWLGHMRDAMESLELDQPYAEMLWRYLESAALSLQNRPA